MGRGSGELRVAQAQLAGFFCEAVRMHADIHIAGTADVAQLVKNGSMLPNEEQYP